MRTLLGVIPVLIFLVLATIQCFHAGLQPDDSGFVALRVADNFRQGAGLVFNPGERRDLVDSPLWISQLSMLTLSVRAPLLVQFYGLILAVTVLLVLLGSARSRLIGAGAALFVAVDGLFVSRVTAGGSEPLAALHLVLLYPILRAARGRSDGHRETDIALAFWAALGAFVRYELILLVVPVALGAGLREPRRPYAWLPLAGALFGSLLCLGLRWSYFGAHPDYWEPWPPTVQSFLTGAQTLGTLLIRRPLLWIGAAILISEWIHGRLWLGRRIGLAWGLAALLIFSMLPARGTDVERHVVAALPLATLLAVEAVWKRARTRPALVAALLFVLAQPGWTTAGRASDPQRAAAYARIGQWLRGHARPGTGVGANTVGALGYHSGMHMEDVAGRVSPRVASARRLLAPGALHGETSAFQSMFRQEPDLVVVLPGDPIPSARTYVPNDDAVPEAIRGPFRIYRWAGSPVWRNTPEMSTRP